MTDRTYGKGLLARFLRSTAVIREPESVDDIREELAAENAEEKKPSSKTKKLLIGVGVFLVLAIPTLVKLFWTLSGYFANKLPG